MAAARPATSASSRARSDESSGRSRRSVASTSSGVIRTVSARVGAAGPDRGGDGAGTAHGALDQREQRDQRVGRLPATTISGSSPAISRVVRSRRSWVSRLRCLAARRAASRRETVQLKHARRGDERVQGDQVVALLHVEALAWRGEEVVEREEAEHGADDRVDATEQGGEQCGDEQEQRGGGEVDVEEAADLAVAAAMMSRAKTAWRSFLTTS